MLTGALVEFSSFSDSLSDNRASNDTRVSIDNNAGAISALAGLNQATGSWDQCLQVRRPTSPCIDHVSPEGDKKNFNKALTYNLSGMQFSRHVLGLKLYFVKARWLQGITKSVQEVCVSRMAQWKQSKRLGNVSLRLNFDFELPFFPCTCAHTLVTCENVQPRDKSRREHTPYEEREVEYSLIRCVLCRGLEC